MTFNVIRYWLITSALLVSLFIAQLIFPQLGIMAYAEKPEFVPPAERPLSMNERPWPHNGFVVLAYHDVEDDGADQRFMSVRTSALNEQFAWLRANGYQPITVDQILAANQGGTPLPPKAVLLTFDDGYSSFYHRVFPLLKAYNWPAILAPVGVWVDVPAGKPVNFGGLKVSRERFTTWEQIAEMSRSGLVEIASHTYQHHYGAIGNPQGNTEPAAAIRIYDPKTGKYESDQKFRQRMEQDVATITQRIVSATGKKPRVWVWPYGIDSGVTLDIAKRHGYKMALTLGNGLAKAENLNNIPRILLTNNPTLKEFAEQVIQVQNKRILRIAHIDLDYVYDPDPIQQARNLDQLVQRIADLRVNAVFLQAFADPKGDGNIHELYFPNRWLPMRADLFNRVSWQLHSRLNIDVYAWMPVLAFELEPSLPRVTSYNEENGELSVSKTQYRRLSPYNPENRRRIKEIYQDLAAHSIFQGVLYHDDAVMSDFEDASSDAIKVYQQAGFPASVAEIRQDPEQFARWSRFKSRYLTEFTQELTQTVKSVRGYQVKTARNIFALPILEPDSEEWFAQNLDDFLTHYDWVAPMAMPLMEKIPLSESNQWLSRLVKAVAQRPEALDKTVFELQAVDWRKPLNKRAISGEQMAEWMRQLQLNGAQNFGYYPDDFLNNQPEMNKIRPVLSPEWYPLND
ncbi:poly-beta-1,6-N-acetyl-D-glucosamine N-deacetylase PgaB [Xenorhabdus cabanillasii]|uniref:HmsF, Haemin storage system protein F, lipoprotein n=1 Tax=Xenorhabdus cabanillasii JM26 TaxID=1427517 RepID=W1IS11_9GAMM|nr:poly-beta-1,6-N-acetyl-D-glucosamine N-deacetylase PgaB [Xenorhabdus cabanillasii]PHM77847.1 polysaccharide deacetylase [Xenorhabdus cabanillasii JM26]CDL80401.1 HmsF, Haemin storage system protein F, lipoprotein [Xenorhabdus cabanillasii JM26]